MSIPASAATASLSRRVAAEFVGTALLLAAVVGSGIMGERLAHGNAAVALLANALATGAVLVALILALSPVSAHFNPLVTLGDAWSRVLRWRDVPSYVGAQLAGAFAGVGAAHLMFAEPLFRASTHARAGNALAFSEFVATFGLVLVLRCSARAGRTPAAVAVAAYIVGAYWFTASTSFANPAVTLARSWTDTFAGIRPLDAPAFLLAQLGGALAATMLLAWLFPPQRASMPAERAPRTVLFACVHNAGRSQMAAAFFTALADPRRARALSAGTQPAEHVHPEVASAMREVGIELDGAVPRRLTSEFTRGADLLITMGCGEACPVVPGLAVRDWPLSDPKGQSLAGVRAVRDEVRARVEALLAEHGWARTTPP